MTQKELAYFEDAVGHEKSIIAICEESIKNLQDDYLITFMEEEISIHKKLQDKLLTLLEEKAND